MQGYEVAWVVPGSEKCGRVATAGVQKGQVQSRVRTQVPSAGSRELVRDFPEESVNGQICS